MEQRSRAALVEHFSALEDPRQQAKVLYPLPEIVLLLLCATLAGADDFVEMRLWDKQNLSFLRRFLAPFCSVALKRLRENTKRVGFMEFLRLPQPTDQPLELALNLEEAAEDRQTLERAGWRIRDASAVAGSPEMYQSYIQDSRGEFSCTKPSCMYFANAWVSDRSICYMASGKPVVVQNTGKSSYLPNGEGMFRFTTMEEVVEAFETINSDYHRHCLAARQIAESLFDSGPILEGLMNAALNKEL